MIKIRSNKPDLSAVLVIAALLITAVTVSAGIIYAKVSERSKLDITVEHRPDIPDKVAYIKSDSYTTPYGTFEPIEHILEINEYMTLNPSAPGSEGCIGYITESEDKHTARSIMEEVKALSAEICKGLDDDKDKVNALAMWVGTNVAYDFDIAESDISSLSVISLEAVIKSGYKTTCGGFANLFSALCHTQNIYCLNMKGGTPADGWKRSELEQAPANHEWNAVAVDGQWYYIDCTWISDYSFSEGEYYGGEDIKPFYAFFGFGEMCIEHRIDRCEYRTYYIQ